MILIGERINGMFSDVKRAIAEKDETVVIDLAEKQLQAGAAYLDLNVGTAAADQHAAIRWLVETVQKSCEAGLCLDSQKPDVIAAGLEAVKPGARVLLNSAPLNRKNDSEILDKYMDMADSVEPKASLIALCMNTEGVPQNVDSRVEIAAEIAQKAMERSFDAQRLFIDPIVLPVKVPNAQVQAGNVLAAIEQIRYLADPAPHITMGLSNLSQGAAERSLINRVFLAMAVSRGADSAIADVFDRELIDTLATAELLMNMQLYSDSFLKVYKSQP
jgi:5-methyltetrahydrofolate corrinoid/iron sulfur protein methyltransferase